MFWGKEKIRDWAENTGIEPFDPKLVGPASIDLRIGKKYRRPSHEVWLPPLEIPKEGVFMDQNDFILFHSLEYVKIPNDAVALLFLRSSKRRQGFEYPQIRFIDPGFEGEFTFKIVYRQPVGKTIHAGDLFCQMSLASIDNVLKPYDQVDHNQGTFWDDTNLG